MDERTGPAYDDPLPDGSHRLDQDQSGRYGGDEIPEFTPEQQAALDLIEARQALDELRRRGLLDDPAPSRIANLTEKTVYVADLSPDELRAYANVAWQGPINEAARAELDRRGLDYHLAPGELDGQD